jgi:hypothetical protein
MSLLPRVLACVGGWLALGATVALPGAALAQTDYSRGKTPPQLFASDCSACHRSPQGLAAGRDARALTAFLHDHYTTKIEWAGLLANYLVGVGGAKSQRAPVTSPTAAPAATAPAAAPPAATAPAATAPAAAGSAAAEPAAPVPPAAVPSAAAPSAAATAAAPAARGARPDEAPSAAQDESKRTAVSARERGKPADPRGPKGKPEGDRDAGARPSVETLQAKLRSYASGGEEAKPVSPAAGAPIPGLRPSTEPAAQPPRSDGGASSAGAGRPTPGSPDAPASR